MARDAAPRPHGRFLAAEVGELAGVSGTTIGQWARRGYIRSSLSEGDPRVYSVEDLLEATVVGELLRRGVRHVDIRHVIARLRAEHGAWPLSEAMLATTAEDGRPRIVLRDREGVFTLAPRGWQRVATPPPTEDVRVRLRRTS